MELEVMAGERIDCYVRRLIQAAKKSKVGQVIGKFNDTSLIVQATSKVQDVVDSYFNKIENGS